MSNKKYFFYVYFTRGILSGIYASFRYILDNIPNIHIGYFFNFITLFRIVVSTLVASLPFLLIMTVMVMVVHQALDTIKEGIGSIILFGLIFILMVLRTLGMGADSSFLSFFFKLIIGAIIIVFIESKIFGLEYKG